MKIVDQDDNYLVTVYEKFQEICHLWQNFPLRSDDVWIITAPKCGTTWTQETTWHIMNNVQLEKTSEHLFTRSPFLDMVTIQGVTLQEAEEMFKKFDMMASPRTIKTHFPLQLLPPTLMDKCKVIFVNRNLKDTCVSAFHHFRLMMHFGFDSNFHDFAEEVYKTGLCYNGGGPAYFSMLKCQEKNRGNPNMLVLWYEDMKQDQKKMITQIKDHLGYNLTADQIDSLAEFMKFENYQKVSSVNKKETRKATWKVGEGQFLRKGLVGDWKNYFNEEMKVQWSAWIDEELKKAGIDERQLRSRIDID